MTSHYPEAITELDEDQAWRLLEAGSFGRLAYHVLGEVHIVPINYAVHDRRIIFRTAEGSKLLGILMNEDVAFETDDIGDDQATSVIVRGRGRQLEEHEATELEDLPLHPWVPTLKYNTVEISVDSISGRHFVLHRED